MLPFVRSNVPSYPYLSQDPLARVFSCYQRARPENHLCGTSQQTGVAFGRKAKLTEEQAEEMCHKRSEGVLIKDLMSEYAKQGKCISFVVTCSVSVFINHCPRTRRT